MATKAEDALTCVTQSVQQNNRVFIHCCMYTTHTHTQHTHNTQEGGGKAIGRLRVVAGGMGLAHLRLQPALDSAAGSRKLQLAHAPHVRVLPQRPSWWPSMWGKEDGQ